MCKGTMVNVRRDQSLSKDYCPFSVSREWSHQWSQKNSQVLDSTSLALLIFQLFSLAKMILGWSFVWDSPKMLHKITEARKKIWNYNQIFENWKEIQTQIIKANSCIPIIKNQQMNLSSDYADNVKHTEIKIRTVMRSLVSCLTEDMNNGTG